MKESFEANKIYPIKEDVQNLEREAENLPSGDIAHKAKNLLSSLYCSIELASRKGWTDERLEEYNREALKIRKLIFEARIQKARDQGLM